MYMPFLDKMKDHHDIAASLSSTKKHLIGVIKLLLFRSFVLNPLKYRV